MEWPDDDGAVFDYDGEERDDEQITCIACCCVIGDEVPYGDDWGEGPLCLHCAGMEDTDWLAPSAFDEPAD